MPPQYLINPKKTDTQHFLSTPTKPCTALFVAEVMASALARWIHDRLFFGREGHTGLGRRRSLSKQRQAQNHVGTSPRESFPNVDQIEADTGRHVSIAILPTATNLAKCHSQAQSPLYCVLPPEIRMAVFAYATTPGDDPKFRYKPSDPWYRPDLRARQKAETALLLTCRRIWLEANHLPLPQSEQYFWFCRKRYQPPHVTNLRGSGNEFTDESWRLRRFAKKLPPRHRYGGLGHIQLFASVGWLKQSVNWHIPWLTDWLGLCPRTLTITVRSVDWPGYATLEPLAMSLEWLQRLLHELACFQVQEFRLELETEHKRSSELLLIVSRFQEFQGRGLGMGGKAARLVPVGAPVESTWTRSHGWLSRRTYTMVGRQCGARQESVDEHFPLPGPIGHAVLGGDQVASRWEQVWSAQGSLLRFQEVVTAEDGDHYDGEDPESHCSDSHHRNGCNDGDHATLRRVGNRIILDTCLQEFSSLSNS